MSKPTRSERIADSTARQVMLALENDDRGGSATITEYAALNPDGSVYWRAYANEGAAKRVVESHPGTTMGTREITVKIKVGKWIPEKAAPKFKAGDRVTISSDAASGYWTGKRGTILSHDDERLFPYEVEVDKVKGPRSFYEEELTLIPVEPLTSWEKELLNRPTPGPGKALLKVGDRVEVKDTITAEFEGLYGTILTVATDARGRTNYIVEHSLSGSEGWVYSAAWVRAA